MKNILKKLFPGRQTDKLTNGFKLYWLALNGPEFVEEYRFHPDRKWRFDFAIPAKRVAVELEGGVWTQGRHTRGAGFIGDCEKYNEAILLGWTVFRLPGDLVNSKTIEKIIRYVRSK